LTSPPWSDSLIRRTVPASVYIDVDSYHFEVERAFLGLLSAFDFEIAETFPPLRGSWFRAFTARAKRATTTSEFTAQLAKLERALDSAQGDAVAKLMTALDSAPNAVLQIGSVLLIKVDGVPVVRTLTRAELSPALLRDPAAALRELT
jgi:hypothetical protein